MNFILRLDCSNFRNILYRDYDRSRIFGDFSLFRFFTYFRAFHLDVHFFFIDLREYELFIKFYLREIWKNYTFPEVSVFPFYPPLIGLVSWLYFSLFVF